jgi:hypothetical protein
MSRDRGPRTGIGDPAALLGPLASGLALVGGLLVLLGLVRALVVFEVLPAEVTAALGAWWPLLAVGAGMWSMMAGRRITGAALAVAGALLLVITAVPAGLTVPVLLIGLGVLLLWGSFGGRRWLLGAAVAVFDDVRADDRGEAPAHSFVALFGESSGRLDTEASDGLVECLAVFGDVEVEVPADVAVDVTEVVVFGEVRAPGPPTAPVTTSVQVRATSVFGDVRLVRAGT